MTIAVDMGRKATKTNKQTNKTLVSVNNKGADQHVHLNIVHLLEIIISKNASNGISIFELVSAAVQAYLRTTWL